MDEFVQRACFWKVMADSVLHCELSHIPLRLVDEPE